MTSKDLDMVINKIELLGFIKVDNDPYLNIQEKDRNINYLVRYELYNSNKGLKIIIDIHKCGLDHSYYYKHRCTHIYAYIIQEALRSMNCYDKYRSKKAAIKGILKLMDELYE